MIIKQLEIVGFKSFGNRTRIALSPGINAIVGPNGCGKSNVLDALRWVMGEQSARQLRGKAMEDVIFSGADGKAPVQMAQVSVVLSRTDGDHGVADGMIDSGEVEITRRLYRSGESEYLLDNHPCRLKDIQLLLMGSGGMGKSFAVVQQGNIGDITEATPEARRQYIDEAGGATRYRAKRSEAQKKLDETAENMQRLEDVLNEIRRQMSGLERQARKARTYLQLQHQVQRLEMIGNLHILDQENHLIAALEQQSAELLRQTQSQQQSLAAHRKAADSLQERIDVSRNRNRGIAERIRQIERQLDKTKQENVHLESEIRRYEREAIESRENLAGIAEKRAGLDVEWQALQGRKVFLEARNRELDARMETAKQAETMVRKQMDGLNLQLEAIRKKILNLSASQARTLQASQSAADNRRQAERKLKRLEEEILVAAREKKAQERSLREIDAQIEEISGSIREMEQTLAQKRNLLDVQSASFKEMTEHVRTLSDRRHGIEMRLSTLRKLTDSYEGFQDGVKALMHRWAKSEGAADLRMPGISEVVANILEPEPGYEAALEAGLNELLQGIVIDSADTARNAIEYLVAGKAGRCGFLVPVPDASRIFPPDHPLPAGVTLIDHVRITRDVPMLCALLSRIIVVETLEEALARRDVLAEGRTIVTRDGMRIDMGGGVIVGGSRSDAGGILFRKTEIRRLETELSECLIQLGDGQQACKARELQVRELENAISRIIQDIRNEKDDLQEAEKRRIQIEESGKHLRRNIDILHIERERLSGEETDSESEISRLQDVLAQIEGELQTEQDRLDGCRKSIGECAGKLEALQNERQALQVDWTASGAQLENTIDTLRRLERFRTESDQRIAQLNERIADIQKQHASCAAQMAANAANIEAWSMDFSRLGETLLSAEAELESLVLQRSAMEETIRAVQENRDSAAQQIQALEIELARHREKRDRAKNDMTTLSAAPLSELRRQLSEVLDDPAFDSQANRDELQRKKVQLQQFGDINTAAIRELEEIRERHTFLQTQKDDLLKAMNDIQSVIRKIDRLTQDTFLQTFEAVNGKLQEVFPQLFDGGSAGLVMTEPNNPLETGVEFMIQPPGKRLTRISLLSGGEKALCAIAFIFSIFLIRPASFCLLDEIDAPLDEANVQRFNRLLGIVGEKAQILMATHNRRTMAFADMLIGVTTENRGISRIVPVKWEEINHFVKENE